MRIMKTNLWKISLVAAALLLFQLPAGGQDCNSGDGSCAEGSCAGVGADSSCHDGACNRRFGGESVRSAAAANNPGGYPNGAVIYNRAGVRAANASLQYPWHCNYYNMEWGTPVALAIPPTAERSFNMGWGVGNTRLTRNWHQFGRPYPGDGAGATGRSFQATPPWPSDTSQFGVYYVRGPW
jgi:hypothetical protein